MAWWYQGPLDEHGQPPKWVNAGRIDDRTLTELIGMVRGIAADDIVNPLEIAALRDWLVGNKHLLQDDYVAAALINRIDKIFKDDFADAEECEDFLDLLHDILGGDRFDPHVHSKSTHLPLDLPFPEIKFDCMEFCVTGKFVFGTRKEVVRTIEENGGVFKPNVVQSLNYLVVGVIGSRDWIQSIHGRKIEQAKAYKKRGLDIKIVSEDHFVKTLGLLKRSYE
jgi:NAD-dependent DNA ligase